MEEEQRLRALLALEKATGCGKADRLAAERAQRQRAASKRNERREAYSQALEEVMKEEAEALRKKHGVTLKRTAHV